MTGITFYERADGEIIGFKSKGHSGYAARGNDIVCASVSILLINTVNAIDELTSDKVNAVVNERRATIDFEIDGKPSSEAQVLLKALKLGAVKIAEEYPGNVSIQIREV